MNISSKFRKVFRYLICICLIFIFSACANSSNTGFDFKADDKLAGHIDTSGKSYINGVMGSSAPRVVSYNDNTLGIWYNNYLSLYDISSGNVLATIKLDELGFNGMQGDLTPDIRANDKYIILNKFNEKNGYVIDANTGTMAKIDDTNLINARPIEYTSIEDKYKDLVKNSQNASFADGQIVTDSNSRIIFYYDLNKLENSQIFIMDKNYEDIGNFTLG